MEVAVKLEFYRSMLGIAAGTLLLASGANAQKVAPPPDPKDQNAPSQFDSQAGNRKNETLSERLDRTDGVIKPPAHVDPGIHETPPPTGDKGIVLPPQPGPGVDPAAKPK
jgi:hypothetical protein